MVMADQMLIILVIVPMNDDILGDNVKNKSKLVNSRLSDYLSTTNGRLVASLVREFLEFFDLDYTLAVFDPETNTGLRTIDPSN